MMIFRLGTVLPLSHLISGLGFLSQLIRLWSKACYWFTLNKQSYFADTVSA